MQINVPLLMGVFAALSIWSVSSDHSQTLAQPSNSAAPAPVASGWGVCWSSVGTLVGSVNTPIEGPFQPAQPISTIGSPPPAPPSGPSVQVSVVVSRVFQWSGSTNSYAGQFDQYIAQALQNLPPPLQLVPPSSSNISIAPFVPPLRPHSATSNRRLG
jgi:hypothetical protein